MGLKEVVNEVLESFHVVVVDNHDNIIGKKKFDTFPTDDDIKHTLNEYAGWSAYVWKCYQTLPFE